MSKLFASLGRFLRALPFTLGALAAWAASAGFNALFGWKLGGDSLELRVLWVLLFVAFDIMKGGAGLKLMAALRNRDALRILLAAGMLTAGTSLSLLAAFQWRVLAKAEAEAARRQIVETRAALATTIEQDRVKASQLSARDLASIEAEIASLKLSPRYKTSVGCTDATRADSRTLCIQLAANEGERSRAAERAYREKAVADNERKLAALKVPTAASDPMAASMASLLAMLGVRADLDQLSDLVALAVTLLAEFGAVVGPMLAGGDRPQQRERIGHHKTARQPLFRRAAPTYPAAAFLPLDGRKADRDEALVWMIHRAPQDERVKYDGEAIVATNAQLAKVWGRPTSTVNDWLAHWQSEGLIRKQATARGTRIQVLSCEL